MQATWAWGYWLPDMSIRCFVGWHLRLSLGRMDCFEPLSAWLLCSLQAISSGTVTMGTTAVEMAASSSAMLLLQVHVMHGFMILMPLTVLFVLKQDIPSRSVVRVKCIT